MANLTHSTGKWTTTVDQTYKNKKYSFQTKDAYNDGDIELNVSVPGIHLAAGETFYIIDPIDTWNWEVDSQGNVCVY